MVELRLLTGKAAGSAFSISRFPCSIGRGADADIRLEEPGVWDRHLQIELTPGQGFVLVVDPQARATVNGQATEQAVVKNGDVIDAGSIKLQFWLSPVRQGGMRAREIFIWLSMVLLAATEIALVYAFLQ